jgi:hypothetical protein
MATMLNGCAQVRKVTYPDDFVYLDESLVQTAMLRMSLAIRGIDQIMIQGESLNLVDGQRIRQHLSTIDEVTDSLGAGDRVTNHLLIDEHIDEFKREVRQAIRNANATPPDYYAAGRLSGNCVGCHRYRN